MPSKLDQLRHMSVVVADTGDIDAIQVHRPVDCTTNPSLVLKAAASPRYASLAAAAVTNALRLQPDRKPAIALAARHLAVGIGVEIAKLVPGRISTEVDARLSFDTDAMEAEGQAIIAAYAEEGIGPERVLIKIAATWEGIRAAERLQRKGIDTNMTLVFGLDQALACADVGAFLISPFVGRILDWHRQTSNATFTIDTHPGVASVRAIHQAYGRYGFKTAIMAASFRSVEEIEALAGCDRLTIAPAFLDALAKDDGPLVRKLEKGSSVAEAFPKIKEADFRWALNEDAMVTAKLSEGIRVFAADWDRLMTLLEDR
jgi:transaldolase